jgi:muramoyltetrapeptide carboxypeptidase
MDKRSFAKMVGAGMSLAALPAAAQAAKGKPAARARTLIKPPRLREGDLVGLITPSGHVSEEKIAKSIRNIEALGLRVKQGKHIREGRGNYAGAVWQRLEDLHAMFADPDIKGIWAATGGSGAISLLPHIDYALIRKHPKALVGYSDITALHLAISRQAGLVTFHGPVASSSFGEYATKHLRAVLMEAEPNHVIQMSAGNAQQGLEKRNFALRTMRHGVREGRLTGGNLSLVAALAGTPYGTDYDKAILFLEDIGEAPYRVDRMMTQLDLSLGFGHAAALMLGIFHKCEATDGEPSLTLAETIDDQTARLMVPSVYGYSFGHIADQFTLPIGVMARLDTAAQTLTLLEPAVQA